MTIRDFVYNYKTKYSSGFTDNELNEIIKIFPSIDRLSFHKSFFGNTCSAYVDKDTGVTELVNYHEDVVYVLSNHLKGQNFNILLRKYKLEKIINKL